MEEEVRSSFIRQRDEAIEVEYLDAINDETNIHILRYRDKYLGGVHFEVVQYFPGYSCEIEKLFSATMYEKAFKWAVNHFGWGAVA